MDKEEYIRKMEEKLSDQTTYKLIEKDPTEEIKTAISNQLNKIKDEGQKPILRHSDQIPFILQILKV